MDGRKRWVRGGLTLVLVGGAAAWLAASPVGAAFNPTKASIKKIAKKEVNKASKTFYRQSAPVTVPLDSFAFGEVACPPGTEATGGGVSSSAPSVVGISTPTDGSGAYAANVGAAGAGQTGWGATVLDVFSNGPFTMKVYVVCQNAKTIDSNYAAGSSTYRGPVGWQDVSGLTP